MFTYFPYWDISYLVAISFALGSAVWVCNGFFSLLPMTNPPGFPGESSYGSGITALIGVTIFEIGSILLLLESVNENRTGCFGWAVEQLYHSEGTSKTTVYPDKDACTHHHQNKGNLLGRPATDPFDDPAADPTPEGPRSWVWFPSKHELQAKYLHECGFLACFIQFLSATVFGISGITALPGILNNMSPPLVNALYWTPQLVGAAGFITSSLMFMLETQTRWWKPALGTLGWHMGFWNLVGSLGFFLSPAFGYDRAGWAQFQAVLMSFWGSWAFLIGSVIQWYESLEKYPVEREKTQ